MKNLFLLFFVLSLFACREPRYFPKELSEEIAGGEEVVVDLEEDFEDFDFEFDFEEEDSLDAAEAEDLDFDFDFDFDELSFDAQDFNNANERGISVLLAAPSAQVQAFSKLWRKILGDLQVVMNKIVQEKRSAAGELMSSLINYSVLVKGHKNYDRELDKKFTQYLAFLAKSVPVTRFLGQSKSSELSDLKKAFWINNYNVCMINIARKNYPRFKKSGAWSPFGLGAWDKELCSFKGVTLSLNQIEHAILRNAEARKTKPLPKVSLALKSKESGLGLSGNHDFSVEGAPATKNFDERIHYAINCASASCPALAKSLMTAKNVNTKLNTLIKDFWKVGTDSGSSSGRQLRVSGSKYQINKIFDWFKTDFPSDINSYVSSLAATGGKKFNGYFSYNKKPNLTEANQEGGQDVVYEENMQVLIDLLQ